MELGRNHILDVLLRRLVMYVCEECGSMFDEPESVRYCLEEYNGVSSLFGNRHYGYYEACPYCGSEEIESKWEEDDEDIMDA